jgi:L-ascorbate metabolism protein UlaG (beta-lactamase superfamily)
MPEGSPHFLVPLGLKAWFAELGITRVDELDWWQQTREAELAITFVPAHADVADAVTIRADLRAARAIGIHWGTFESLADEALDEPPKVLARQREGRGLAQDEFDVMKIGETRRLERAAPR